MVLDTKKNLYKLSAKEAVNRYDLRTFHHDLQRYLEQTRGLHANVLNKATIKGNESIEELKMDTAINELQKALAEVQTVKNDTPQVLENNKNALKRQIRSLEGKAMTLHEVNRVKIKKPLLGSKKRLYRFLIKMLSTYRERLKGWVKLTVCSRW